MATEHGPVEQARDELQPVEETMTVSELGLDEALALAVRVHRSAHLDEAEMLYRLILDAFPEQPDALHFLGVLTHQRGDSDTAIELIRRSIAIDPALPDRYVNLGNILAECGELDEAATHYREAIARTNASVLALANAWNNLGAVLRTQERYDEAARAYEKAIEIAPEHADAYNNYGNLMSIQGRVSEAVASYCKALTVSPRHAQSRKLLGMAYYTLGRVDEAAQVYREWLADEPDHPVALHMLAACSGENVPARASDAYVESTFDSFAESFDAKLSRLDYRAPQLVADAVARLVGTGAGLDTLDAGCGTGLCGPLLKPYAGRLTGVDLSGGMLKRALGRGVYDDLVQGELTAYLAEHPAAFDLIVSADTLVYFGPLEAALRAACDALRPGGILGFTVEVLPEESPSADYRINPHGRYSHSRAYLSRALTAAAFTVMAMEPANLRKEGGNPVAGLVVTCRADGRRDASPCCAGCG